MILKLTRTHHVDPLAKLLAYCDITDPVSAHTMQDHHPTVRKVAVDDSELQDVHASNNGDDHAYGRIVRRYQQVIAKRLWRFTRDKQVLEELVQETFVQAWQSLHTYRGDAPLAHWLTRIATRVGYRYWKHQYKQRQMSDGIPVQESSLSIDKQQNTGEIAEYVHALLNQLPPRDRMVLTLIYLEQCSIKEIAQQTGWSQVMVKVQAHRARAKLRNLIDKLENK